jgi:hypothetical protein
MTARTFSFGDKVVHTGKPEWGTGLVTQATKTTHDGKPCQTLTIRFDRAGVKSISTAFATLAPAGDAIGTSSADTAFAAAPGAFQSLAPTSQKEADFAAKLLGSDDIKQRMTKLPDGATDPFTTVLERLKFTLSLYRFQPSGGSLLDWAAMQSGLTDPLGRFNRHELEQFFTAFAVVRDGHLRKLLPDARKADPAGTTRLISQASAPAQQAVRRFDAMR